MVMKSSSVLDSVWCKHFRELIFGILYLYLWYSHITSIANDCRGNINPYCFSFPILYCFHNHLSLSMVMVIRSFPESLYMWASLFCLWIVFFGIMISFSGLASGMVNGFGIYLVSLLFLGINMLL